VTESALALTGELAIVVAANDKDTRDLPARTSHLKQMARSPAHCRHSILNDWEQTLAMRLGVGTHSLLLGGPPVLLCPTKQRRGKDFDAWKARQVEGAIVLTKKEYAKAHAMAASVRANQQAAQVLFAPGTIYEDTIYWEQKGRKRRSTPDARTKSHLVDLKTTRDASPEKFHWDAIRMGYHVQLADYANAMEWDGGSQPKDVYIVAVESKEPFLCTVHRLTSGSLERGSKLSAEWLDKLIECEATGVWPGYADQILDFDVPPDPVDLVWDDEDGNDSTESE
jgi:hypothetical protein